MAVQKVLAVPVYFYKCLKQNLLEHLHNRPPTEAHHRHRGVRVLDLNGLVHIVQGVRSVMPGGVAHRHEGRVSILDDFDFVAVVQHGEVLVVKPGILGVFALWMDARCDM